MFLPLFVAVPMAAAFIIPLLAKSSTLGTCRITSPAPCSWGLQRMVCSLARLADARIPDGRLVAGPCITLATTRSPRSSR